MDDVGLYAKRGVNAEVPNIFGGVEKVPEGEGKSYTYRNLMVWRMK